MQAILDFDFAILEWIAAHLRCAVMDVLMPLVTRLGDAGIFWIVVTLLLLCFRRTRKTGGMMAVAIALGFLVGNLTLKPLVARIRPYDLRPMGDLLVAKLHDYSFPSGHTLVCFEAATVLMLRERRPWGWIALAAAVVVAFSRLYLYVHYPTDVLVGAALGILFGVCGSAIVQAVAAKWAAKQSAA